MVHHLPSDLVEEGGKIKVAWRRNQNSLKTESKLVSDSSASVNQSLSLNTLMVFDRPSNSFISKMTQIELLEAESRKVIATVDLDLANSISDETK